MIPIAPTTLPFFLIFLTTMVVSLRVSSLFSLPITTPRSSPSICEIVSRMPSFCSIAPSRPRSLPMSAYSGYSRRRSTPSTASVPPLCSSMPPKISFMAMESSAARLPISSSACIITGSVISSGVCPAMYLLSTAASCAAWAGSTSNGSRRFFVRAAPDDESITSTRFLLS